MYWITWIAITLLWLILALAGLVVVPIAALFTRQRASDEYPNRVGLHFPAWAWLWDNEENGVDGNSPTPGWGPSSWLGIVKFVGFRNAVSNFRFWSPVKVLAWNPGEVNVVRAAGTYGQPGCYWFITKGKWIAGYLRFVSFRGKVYRFWWGWEFWPGDAQDGIRPTDGRYPGVDFARQFHEYTA